MDIDFTDLSSDVPTGWAWDFGDTGSSGLEHPSHQYTTPGTYTVSLSATNATGTHTRVQPNLIVVTVPEPSVIASLVSGSFALGLMHKRRSGLRIRKGQEKD